MITWHILADRSWRPVKGSHIYGSVDYGYGDPWSFHLHAAPRAEVVDPYQDLDPLSRAHHQAQDKRLEGGKCRSSTSGCS